MDPVDKTFDMAYAVYRAAGAGAGALAERAGHVIDAVRGGSGSGAAPPPAGAPRGAAGGLRLGLGRLGGGLGRLRLGLGGGLATALLGLGTAWLATRVLRSTRPKRRAHRLANGARKDVVLIVGSTSEPLTRSLATDLERRGFIVYITSTDPATQFSESHQDIRTLVVSHDDPEFNKKQLLQFSNMLSMEHLPFPGAKPSSLELKAVIVVPDFYFTRGKFHSVSENIWKYNLTTKLLTPVCLLNCGIIEMCSKYQSNLIFVTSPVKSKFRLKNNSIENLVMNFLDELAANLATEYPDLNIVNLKFGLLKFSSNNKNMLYKFGQPIRNFYYKVFDLLYAERVFFSVQYVGFGARFFTYFGRFIPNWFINMYIL